MLEQEVEVLSLYLELEALRFNNQLDWTIDVAPDLDARTLLPPMLIQPYVENAIKHGLLEKQPPAGSLRIEFSKANEGLQVSVTDNGIGREAAELKREQHNPEHQSFATKAVQQRIDLINREGKRNINVSIHDLVDAAGEASGTQVLLHLTV